SETDLRLDVEEEGQVGPVVVTEEIRELVDKVQRDAAAVTLICHRRVIVTIADDRFAAVQRRLDHFLNVLTSRCEEQQKLRRCRQMDRFRSEQDFPNALADSRPSGLACDRVRYGILLEVVG